MKNKILKRQRVENALDGIFQHPLTIVSATIGYGKTTAVKEWVKGKDLHVVCFSLYENDLHESISWHKFTVAWEKTFAGRHSLKSLNGFPRDIHQVSEFIDILIGAASSKPIVVICEDYHNVDCNPRIRSLVEQITQEEIPNFHIVLLSRHLTQINSALLSSKGLCYIINTEVLAFTSEETLDYFALNGLSTLSADLLNKIEQFAEGWPAALVLTQMSVSTRTQVPILDMDYLMYECFNNLFDTNSRDLLSKLSFLSEFSIPQAVYILETRDIIQILDVAMNQNAFIYFDYKASRYRLHALARIFLQKNAHNKAIDLVRPKYLNGVWLMENGKTYESVNYFIDTGNALDLMRRLNDKELGYICYLNTDLFYKLCQSLPLDTCTQYPIPYLHMIFNFVASGKPPLVAFGKRLLDTMERYFANSPLDKVTPILGEIEVIKAAINFSDVYKVMEHIRNALLFLEGRESKISQKSDPTNLGIPMYTYIFFKNSGELKNIIDFHRMEFVPILSTYNIMHGVDQLLLAEYALEIGAFDKARHHAQLATYIALNKKSISVYICATFTLIRYDLAHSQPEKSLERLAALRELLSSNRADMLAETNAIHNTTVALCDAYIKVTLGELDFIPDWIKNGDLDGGVFKMGGLGFLNILRSKVLVHEQRWMELEALTSVFEQSYSEYQNRFGLLHNSMYLAIAKYNLYGIEAGSKELLNVLKQAEKDHLILMIAENAKHVLPILRHIQSSKEMSSEYFQQLVNITIKYSQMRSPVAPATSYCPTIHFTDRELEVLRLLKQGLMGREIADQLCLSLIAVKKHLGNVYKKLGVTHKGAAIKKIHDLKI